MLDIKLIRENPEIVRKDLEKRHEMGKMKLVDDLIKHDNKWRELLKEGNDLRKKRNDVSQEIAKLKSNGKESYCSNDSILKTHHRKNRIPGK